MPTAGDAYLKGQLPAGNNPLNRMQMGGINTKVDPAQIIAQWTQFVEDYLIEIFKDVTGIDLSSFDNFITSLFTNTAINLSGINATLNQIIDIFNGLVVTPINAAIQGVKDWWVSVGTFFQDTWDSIWQGLTGGTATGKTTADVKTATSSTTAAVNTASTNASSARTTVTSGFQTIANTWSGGSSAVGTPAEVGTTIADMKSAIVGGYTVETLTTSGSWTVPTNVDTLREFWAICIGAGTGGNSGGKKPSGATAMSGGAGGLAGAYVAQQINPASLGVAGDTISYAVPAGGAGGVADGTTTHVAGGVGGDASFGTLASSGGVTDGSIATLFGFYDATNSKAGGGGRGQGFIASGGADGLGTAGDSTPLATGGAAAGATTGATGGAGGNASTTASTRSGGAGGGGGGSGTGTTVGGDGGAGGFPGGGGGGGGSCLFTASAGGNGGNGGNGVVVLLYR